MVAVTIIVVTVTVIMVSVTTTMVAVTIIMVAITIIVVTVAIIVIVIISVAFFRDTVCPVRLMFVRLHVLVIAFFTVVNMTVTGLCSQCYVHEQTQ